MNTKSSVTSFFILVTFAAESVCAFGDDNGAQAGAKGKATNGQKDGANGQKNNGQQGQKDDGQQGQKNDGQQGQKDGGQQGQHDGAQKQQNDGGQKGPKNGVQQRQKTPEQAQGVAAEATRKQMPDAGKMVAKQDKLAGEATLEKLEPEHRKLSDAPKTEEERARQRVEEARQILDSRVIKLLGAGSPAKK